MKRPYLRERCQSALFLSILLDRQGKGLGLDPFKGPYNPDRAEGRLRAFELEPWAVGWLCSALLGNSRSAVAARRARLIHTVT